MGKKLTVTDCAARLGLPLKYVQEKLKPDIFDFLEDELDEPLVSIERDRINTLILKFIDTEAGNKHFKHNRAKNEWNHKHCSEQTTIFFLDGMLRTWLKNKERRAQGSDHRRHLDNPGPGPGGTQTKPVSTTAVEEDQRSSRSSSWEASPPVQSPQIAPQRRARLDTIDSETAHTALPDIPHRRGMGEELEDIGEIFRERREAQKRAEAHMLQTVVPTTELRQGHATFATTTPPPEGSRESVRAPLQLNTNTFRSGLLSPPATSRKRSYQEATEIDEDDCVEITQEDVMIKKAKIASARLSAMNSAQVNASADREQPDRTSRVTSSSSPSMTRANIPISSARPQSRQIDRAEPSASLRAPADEPATNTGPTDINNADPQENTSSLAQHTITGPQQVLSNELTTRQPSTQNNNIAGVSVLTVPQHHTSMSAAEPLQDSVSVSIEKGPEVKERESVPRNPAEPLSHESVPGSAAMTSSPTLTARFHSHRTPSESVRPQPPVHQDVKPKHHRLHNSQSLSPEELLVIVDFLHNCKKDLSLALHCDDPNCEQDRKLKDKRSYLRELEEKAELQLQYPSRA